MADGTDLTVRRQLHHARLIAVIAATAVAAGLAALVGVARIVHGAHLPADVMGGWSFGVLVGLGAIELADRLAPRSTAAPVRGEPA